MRGSLLRSALLVCALLTLSLRPALPQDAPAAPLQAQKLAGYVHMASQKHTALATVLVEECDAGWNRVLASTRTDDQGHFNLKPIGKKKMHYLRISASGFKTRQYEIVLSPYAAPQVNLEIELTSERPAGAD